MASVEIRAATEADLEAVWGVDVAGHDRDLGRRPLLAARIREEECWVALEARGPIGFVIFGRRFYDQPFIELVVVNPDYRRRGVATVLITHVESLSAGPKLFTSTNESNDAMRRLCKKLGFAPSGRIENLDEGDPELVFFKRID